MELNGRYLLTDYESGQLYEVSKEYHDSYLLTIKSFLSNPIISNFVPKLFGRPIVFGTTGDLDGTSEDFHKMFYENTLLRPEETEEDNL